jgi:hypothetical protein
VLRGRLGQHSRDRADVGRPPRRQDPHPSAVQVQLQRPVLPGTDSKNFISAENVSDKFLSSIFGPFPTQATCIKKFLSIVDKNPVL